jgi:tetratricopeptide (TPR) repeat protein
VVVQLKPGDANAHYNLGLALVHQGKPDEAIRHWLEVIRLDPNNTNAHYNLGQAKLHQGKFDEAIRHWLDVIRLDPNNIDALVNLGGGYAKIGKFREAVLFSEKALNLARAAGDEQLAQKIQQRIELYKQKM